MYIQLPPIYSWELKQKKNPMTKTDEKDYIFFMSSAEHSLHFPKSIWCNIEGSSSLVRIVTLCSELVYKSMPKSLKSDMQKIAENFCHSGVNILV